MTSKILVASLAAASLVAAASAAHAEGVRIGGQVQILPMSELKGDDLSIDLDTSFALAGTLDFAVHPNVDIGAAPRIAFGLQPEDYEGDDSLTQLDLAARVTAHTLVAPKVEIHGFVSPGYSFLTESEEEGDEDTASGFILGFGGGVGFAVSPTLSLVGELGYQLGFQEFEGDKAATNLLHLGFGLRAAL